MILQLMIIIVVHAQYEMYVFAVKHSQMSAD